MRYSFCVIALIGLVAPAQAQNASHPDDERIVVLSNPPGISIVKSWDKTKPIGKTPLVLKREPSEWTGVRTEMFYLALPSAPGECRQALRVTFDQVAPDTVVFDMSRCRAPIDDFNRVFDETELDSLPERKSSPMLDYPDDLRKAGTEGFILIEAVIDTAGRATDTRVLAYNELAFAREGLRAIEGSRYKPGWIEGRKVKVKVHIPVSFTIRR